MQHGIQTGTLAYCDPAGHRHTLPVSWSMATEVPPQAVRR
jgi:hypothetical protein